MDRIADSPLCLIQSSRTLAPESCFMASSASLTTGTLSRAKAEVLWIPSSDIRVGLNGEVRGKSARVMFFCRGTGHLERPLVTGGRSIVSQSGMGGSPLSPRSLAAGLSNLEGGMINGISKIPQETAASRPGVVKGGGKDSAMDR